MNEQLKKKVSVWTEDSASVQIATLYYCLKGNISLLHMRHSSIYEEKLNDSSLKIFIVIKNRYLSK